MPEYATYPSLRGKRVLISGGAEGIGAAAVELFCRRGSDVAFLDHAEVPARALVARLAQQQTPGGATTTTPAFLRCDVTDLEQLQACAERAGAVDVLVNNAGRAGGGFFLTQAVAPGMRARGRGSVVNLGSITWRIPAADCPVYALCKAAVAGMTRLHAKEFGPDGVRVNSVVPGAVATRRQVAEVLTPEYRARVRAAQSLKRDLLPEEVARLILFLAADDSSAITGSNYVVDGGWVGDV
ncbi:3-oxoacyl-reductase [Xylariomycetidae sp. FL0641]|nr:3-oxoacyl-reductase [Xylariomycetidae sp. FL0641]